MKTVDTGPATSRLKIKLKGKSGRRREDQKRVHEAERRTANAPLRNDLLPKLELVDRDVGALIPPAREVRKLDQAHVIEVAAAIRTLGVCHPLLINAKNVILDGVGRLAAAKQLGIPSVPCIMLGHLSPAEERAARIAFNRLGERGEWDIEMLRLEVEELMELDAPVEIMGFETPELDLLFSDDEVSGAADEEETVPPVEEVAVTRLGDGWLLDEHRVLCDDALDPASYEALMGETQARATITDVPYNVPIAGHVAGLGRRRHREFVQASGEMSPEQFLAFLVTVIQLAAVRVMDGGLVASFIDWRGVGAMLSAGAANALELLNIVVWTKTNGGMGTLWRSGHELLPVFKVGKASHVNNVQLGRFGRWRSNVWTYPGVSSLGSEARDDFADHPTPKPVALLEDALYDVTNPGEVVLDPFLGSGSMIIAAEKARRICYGLELDPLYVDVILRRWIAVTGRQPVLAETGETFAEVMVRRGAGEPEPVNAPMALLPAPKTGESA